MKVLAVTLALFSSFRQIKAQEAASAVSPLSKAGVAKMTLKVISAKQTVMKIFKIKTVA